MDYKIPEKGVVFWPIGTGDSATIILNGKKTFVQVDLRHMTKSEDCDDPAFPIVDELIKFLPKANEKPFLDTFILTHSDKDHCHGFEKLLDEVVIGELWFSPRIFRDGNDELCDDAKAFKKEAKRRVKATIKDLDATKSGDRVRIIGYDELLKEDDYKDFPKSQFSVPGHEVTHLNGEDYSDEFSAFIHSPFKDFSDKDRNDTSVGVRVKLLKNEEELNVLLLGDLKYETLMHLFENNKEDVNINWNVFLSPHHCSKKVMYTKNEDGEDVKHQDILDHIERVQLEVGYIIASSAPLPSKNKSGDNPPHRKAKNRYEEIVNNEFICTHEHPNEENPEPIVFELDENGISLHPTKGKKVKKSSLENDLKSAKGSSDTSSEKVGYGRISY